MAKHIFNVRTGNEWLRTPGVYSEEEFEHIMDQLKWRLPFNVTVYHFNGRLINKVILGRSITQNTAEEILLPQHNTYPVKIKDRQAGATFPASDKGTGYVTVIMPEGEYQKIIYVDANRYSIITDYEIVPLSFREAGDFVDRLHRHNEKPQGHKFSIGLRRKDSGLLIGVAIASHPKARSLNDGRTLDINRLCSNSIYSDACSKLYAAAIRAGRSMGYKKFITYTLPHESGSSLRAVGFSIDGISKGRKDGWNSPTRPRKKKERYPITDKIRWVLI